MVDTFTQENVYENFSRRRKNVSGFINDKLQSNTHSCQDYVNAAKMDTRIAKEAPFQDDDTSNSRHGSKNRHNTESTASMDIHNSVVQ